MKNFNLFIDLLPEFEPKFLQIHSLYQNHEKFQYIFAIGKKSGTVNTNSYLPGCTFGSGQISANNEDVFIQRSSQIYSVENHYTKSYEN